MKLDKILLMVVKRDIYLYVSKSDLSPFLWLNTMIDFFLFCGNSSLIEIGSIILWIS
jgi:hypothetical protein